jgi:hypothetical protein
MSKAKVKVQNDRATVNKKQKRKGRDSEFLFLTCHFDF